MVAGTLAGLGSARATVVNSVLKTALPLYLLLAGASFAVALLWQSLTPALGKPEVMFMHYYRHVIGQLDGRTCPSYPVCSLYAAQAVAKYGFLTGSWLAMDRIIHEADDLYDDSRWITVNGKKRLYDPLARNDFWITKEKQ